MTVGTEQSSSTGKQEESEFDTLTPGNELENIAQSQLDLGKVKESLSFIIDSMQQSDSLFSRASDFWGNLPLWQKVVGGIAVSVPTLAVGAFAHIGALLTISGFTVIAYTAGGLVLDDHHTCNKNLAERLKLGINNLANVLEITINALDQIRKNLAHEINRFRLENERLTNSVSELGDEVEALTSQVTVLTETSTLLQKSQEQLALTSQKLDQTVHENDLAFKKQQDEMEKIRQESIINQKNLNDKIKELDTVRDKLTQEIVKTNTVSKTLQGTVKLLSDTVITDGEDRQNFQSRLSRFLSDKEKSFDTIAERIAQSEQELALVKEELKASNERYDKLLEKHGSLLEKQENQISRLEKIQAPSTPAKKLPYENQRFYSPNQSMEGSSKGTTVSKIAIPS